MRRHFGTPDTFAQDLEELRGYFRPGGPGNGVHAVPGEGLDMPVWLLGSSDYSARLAARLGLPFAFASHFAPDFLHQAVAHYRHEFEPPEALDRPRVMVGVNAIAAGTDSEAWRPTSGARPPRPFHGRPLDPAPGLSLLVMAPRPCRRVTEVVSCSGAIPD